LSSYTGKSPLPPYSPIILPLSNPHNRFPSRIFLSLGEAGPGDNIGLLAAKTSATAIRGQYYAVAAASGKIGAFIGTYLFPIIQARAPGGPTGTRGGQDPFFVSASLCLLSAALALLALPDIGQDTIAEEDVRFRTFLEKEGWDTGVMGIGNGDGDGSGSGNGVEGERVEVGGGGGGGNGGVMEKDGGTEVRRDEGEGRV
jgi:hypothetical protein